MRLALLLCVLGCLGCTHQVQQSIQEHSEAKIDSEQHTRADEKKTENTETHSEKHTGPTTRTENDVETKFGWVEEPGQVEDRTMPMPVQGAVVQGNGEIARKPPPKYVWKPLDVKKRTIVTKTGPVDIEKNTEKQVEKAAEKTTDGKLKAETEDDKKGKTVTTDASGWSAIPLEWKLIGGAVLLLIGICVIAYINVSWLGLPVKLIRAGFAFVKGLFK